MLTILLSTVRDSLYDNSPLYFTRPSFSYTYFAGAIDSNINWSTNFKLIHFCLLATLLQVHNCNIYPTAFTVKLVSLKGTSFALSSHVWYSENFSLASI